MREHVMGDQVEEEESGVGGLIPYELLPDDKQTGNHGVIVIDGRELTVRQTSRLASQCGSVRMCNKETRDKMNPESLQAYSRAAMGYVLPKTHKLCLPSVKTSGEKVLAQVEQLQYQLQSLKDHMIAYDIYDVMTVVMPEDVMSSPKLLPEKYQILNFGKMPASTTVPATPAQVGAAGGTP